MHENIQDDVEGEVEPEEGEEKKTVDVESVTDKPSQSSKIAIFLRFWEKCEILTKKMGFWKILRKNWDFEKKLRFWEKIEILKKMRFWDF